MRRAKTVATFVHPLLMLGCLVLFVLRAMHTFDPEVVILSREITDHISNFALSLVLCALTGFVLIALGAKLKAAFAVCALVLVANVIYEMFLPFLNTQDPVDAVYGIVGTLAGAVYVCWLDRFGFMPKAQ